MRSCLENSSQGVVLRLYIQPRSSKNQIVGLHGEALKVKLTAPPVDGQANKSLCSFLAKVLATAKSNVSVISGESSRNKKVQVQNIVSFCW